MSTRDYITNSLYLTAPPRCRAAVRLALPPVLLPTKNGFINPGNSLLDKFKHRHKLGKQKRGLLSTVFGA